MSSRLRQFPAFTDSLFFEVQKSGVVLIIIHPERIHAVLNNPTLLLNLVERGALAQLTAESYIGSFGKKTQKFSEKLIEANLVHFIASDAHNIMSRTFYMKDAYQRLEKEFGKENISEFKQVTKDLFNGELITTPLPKKIKASEFLGLF